MVFTNLLQIGRHTLGQPLLADIDQQSDTSDILILNKQSVTKLSSSEKETLPLLYGHQLSEQIINMWWNKIWDRKSNVKASFFNFS